MYASMFAGRFQPALDAADDLAEMLTEDVLRNDQPYTAATLEGYYSMKMHVLVRFGKWQAIVDTPPPGDPESTSSRWSRIHRRRRPSRTSSGRLTRCKALNCCWAAWWLCRF